MMKNDDTSLQEQVSWKQIKGLGNYGYDIKTAAECKSNITCLEAACVSLLYCAGFSNIYNTLKFNVSNSTLNPDRPDNIVFVRDPPPPRMPAPPAFPVWPLPKSFTSGGQVKQVTAVSAAHEKAHTKDEVTWTIVPGLDN
jgi:hypothetical protein